MPLLVVAVVMAIAPSRKVVANAPYKQVEDVLDIPGLSDSQKKNCYKLTWTNLP